MPILYFKEDRIELRWTVFALTMVIGLSIALPAISHQLLKAALADPVDSLRSELKREKKANHP